MKRGPGRPPKNPDLVSKAVDLCEREGITPEEAAERVKGTSQRTIYRALERRRRERPDADDAPEISSAESVAPSRLELSRELADDVLLPADPERSAALRLLVVRGTLPGTDEKGKVCDVPVEFGADWIDRVAAGEGISPRDVRKLLREAAVSARLDALPFELARERSIAVGERFLQMALDAHDGRSGLDAQRHIDRLRLATPEPDPEGLTRAEVTILLRRVALELQGVEGGVEALRRALAEA